MWFLQVSYDAAYNDFTYFVEHCLGQIYTFACSFFFIIIVGTIQCPLSDTAKVLLKC